MVRLLLKNRFLAPKRSKDFVAERIFDKVQLKYLKLVAPCSFCCIGFAPKVQPTPFGVVHRLMAFLGKHQS